MITPSVCVLRKPVFRIATIAGLLASVAVLPTRSLAQSQTQTQAAAPEEVRKIKKATPAEYPELARKVNIAGTVRLQLLVSPEGKVKEAKVLGGNPVLANAFVAAVMKWEYEPAPHKSTITVSCEFKP